MIGSAAIASITAIESSMTTTISCRMIAYVDENGCTSAFTVWHLRQGNKCLPSMTILHAHLCVIAPRIPSDKAITSAVTHRLQHDKGVSLNLTNQ